MNQACITFVSHYPLVRGHGENLGVNESLVVFTHDLCGQVLAILDELLEVTSEVEGLQSDDQVKEWGKEWM